MNEPTIRAAIRDAGASKKRIDLGDSGRDAVTGLRLLIGPTGAATWFLRHRDGEGMQRRYKLGRFPEMGVADARTAARKTHSEVDAGADPIARARQKRKAAKDAREGLGTLSALIDAYSKTDAAKKQKRWAESRRRVEDVFARHLARPLSTLARADLQRTANEHRAAQSAAAAIRYIRPILKWAEAQGDLSETFDAARLKAPAVANRRKRVLSEVELRAVLPVLAASTSPYAAASQFLLYTLARREEVCGARWRDVDLSSPSWADLTPEAQEEWIKRDKPVDIAVWRIPDTKNGQEHVVPLGRQAVALLSARRPRNAKPDEFIFNADGGRLVNWDRETKRIMAASKTSGWTRHDLRRTGATMMGKMSVLPDIIESSLNHVSIHSELATVYNQARYRPQVAAALQSLADRLDHIGEVEAGISMGAAPEPVVSVV